MLDSFGGFVRFALMIGLTAISVAAQTADALQTQAPGASGAPGQASGPPQGPSPTYANIDYAPPDPPTSNGHKLDLYIPSGATQPLPVVIWTGGSAWFADTGKNSAGRLAAQLEPGGTQWRASQSGPVHR
jgi:hypothetical protein